VNEAYEESRDRASASRGIGKAEPERRRKNQGISKKKLARVWLEKKTETHIGRQRQPGWGGESSSPQRGKNLQHDIILVRLKRSRTP